VQRNFFLRGFISSIHANSRVVNIRAFFFSDLQPGSDEGISLNDN
jgi:hypothetical protein